MCYNGYMDTTIRNLDETLYRRIKAQAALEGRNIGALVNEAIRAYLAPGRFGPPVSIRDLEPEPYPDGNERLSEEIDSIVYGI